jgi:hypothetical protein
MNRYNILIITGAPYTKHTVEATNIAWSESGLYEFWKFNDDGKKEAVAYYPVDRTIIESIEYNIN